MKLTLIALIASLFLVPALRADPIFRIEVGKDYQNYTNSDLQRRVWELERAVAQLQQRVFQLETEKPTPVAVADSWICTVHGMGSDYTGTGATKAVAAAKAKEACKAGPNTSNGFHCGSPKCEQ